MASAPYLKRARNGTYYVHWTEGRVGKRVSTREKDLEPAKVFFAQWLTMDRSESAPGTAATVADCWSVYDREHVQKAVAARGKAEYYWTLLEPVFGALAVSDMSQSLIDRYVTARQRTVKPATIRNELVYLMSAIRFCAQKPHKLLDRALVDDALDGLKLPPSGAPKERWLRRDEIDKLQAAAREMRTGDRLSRGERFLWLALETAARKEAILDLTWDRVDFEAGVITFAVPGRRETKKRRATVPISTALMTVLRQAHAERACDLVMDNKGEVWATVQSIVMRAGLAEKQRVATGQKPKATGISPHTFRHTAATHMARAGVPLWTIAQVLGNTLQMVEKVYAKWQPEAARAAVNMISGEKEKAA